MCDYGKPNVPSHDGASDGVWGRIFEVVCITWWPRKLFVSRCVPAHADGAFSWEGVGMETKGKPNKAPYRGSGGETRKKIVLPRHQDMFLFA